MHFLYIAVTFNTFLQINICYSFHSIHFLFKFDLRSESSYNVAKSILVKIAKKHGSSFNPAMNFFVANINYEEETGKQIYSW